MLEFCAGAPSLGQLRTCLTIFDDAWWEGFSQGFGAGFVCLIVIMLIIHFIQEKF